MALDANAAWTSIGAFLGSLGYCTVLANLASYYRTKRNIYYTSQFGKDITQNYLEREMERFEEFPITKIFGIGTKLALNRYLEGKLDVPTKKGNIINIK
jgi:hypothetical protein